MCTPKRKFPLSNFSTWTASSKSLAVSPSIVTMGNELKSMRPPVSELPSSWLKFSTCRRTAGGKSTGIWCLRMMISTSRPKSPRKPRTSTTLPRRFLEPLGNCVISTLTMESGGASMSSPSRITISWPILVS